MKLKKMKLASAVCLAALMAAPMPSFASSNYHVVMVIKKKDALNALNAEAASAWVTFAQNNGPLDHDAEWENTSWANESLTYLPSEPYPNSFPTSIALHYNSLTQVDALSSLKTIGSNLYLGDNGLLNINGLANLETVYGSLDIKNNNLTDASALDGVTIHGTFNASNNNLDDVMWFSGVTPKHHVYLGGNAIASLQGMESFTSFPRDLGLEDNLITNVDGLSSLESVAFSFDLSNNQIGNLNGLSSLKTVGGRFWISRNDFTDLTPLSSLTSVYEFRCDVCKATSLAGLENLRTITNFFATSSSITNVDALSGLTTIGDMVISGSLQNLNGLSSLTTVGSLHFTSSPDLVDISGLSNVSSIAYSIRLDSGIDLRLGFVPIPSGSWLCSAEATSAFTVATQAEACGL